MRIEIIEFLNIKERKSCLQRQNISQHFCVHFTKVFVNAKNLRPIIILLNKDIIQKDHKLYKLLVLRQLLVL